MSAAPEVRLFRVAENAAEAARERPMLSDEERTKAEAFLRRVDRERYLVAHTALRRELAARLGTTPAEVPLTRTDCPLCGGPHGRPSVPGDPLHFSLSHAGDVVLLAFADRPVGVDVEQEPEGSVVDNIVSALHPREAAELTSASPGERPAAFARCWTRKEAYLKGTGTGLGESLSVTYVGTGEQPAAPDGWTIADVPVPDGYAAATAVSDR
jgi:4'-phosphopantetheinyl transferase